MLLLRLFAAAAGCVLISWSFLLYESEERAVRDALVAWWIKVDDVAGRVASKNLAVVKLASVGVARWVDAVFGADLLTVRAVAVSISLSLSSLLIGMCVLTLEAIRERKAHVHNLFEGIVAALIVVSIFAAGASAFHVGVSGRRERLRQFLVGLLLVCYFVVAAVATLLSDWRTGVIIAPLVGVTIGVGSDFLVVFLIRAIARRNSRPVATVSAFFMAFLATAVGIVILPLPFVITHDAGLAVWAVILSWAGATNLYAGIVALCLAIIFVSYPMNRLLWFFLDRPLYSLQRFEVLQNRRLLFFTGSVLLAFALPATVTIFTAIRALL